MIVESTKHMAVDDPEHAILEELLNEALQDFEGVVSAEVMAAIRDELSMRLVSSDAGRRLLRQVRPDPVVTKSGDVVDPAAGESADTPTKRGAG